MEEIGSSARYLVNFRLFYLISQVVGVTIVILVLCWIGIHLNGFGWAANPSIQFNWHPFLMVLGMIFLYGNCKSFIFILIISKLLYSNDKRVALINKFSFSAILVYRGFRNNRKRTLKITHACIHGAAFLFTVIALIAVFDSHNLANPPIPNMYSLHSWIGLSAVILFAMQYVVGFVTFLFPEMRQPVKETIMPSHIFFGTLGFVMAIGAALLGFSEKAFFHM